MFFYEKKEREHTNTGDEMRQNTQRYVLNFTLFVGIAFFNTQLIPFLKEIGYDTMERGVILAVNALFSIILQVLFGFLCDRFQSMKRFFYIAYALFLGFGCMMFWIVQETFFLHLLLTSMMASMVKVVTAIIESWMLYLDKESYGKYRAIGAFGLCVGSPLIGMVITYFSYTGVIISCVAVSFVVLYSAFKVEEVEYEERIDYKQMLGLLKNKQYMYFVGIYFFTYMVGTADQYAVLDKMLALEASSTLIGIKWAVQSLLEIPFFLYANKLLKKYSPYTLLGFGIVLYGVKFVCYGFSPDSYWIIASATLQIVTLPVIAYTSKMIFESICPTLKASAQMLAMAIFIGGSAFVTPLITSALIGVVGYDITLYICALFTTLPFLLLLLKNRVLKKES